MPQTEVEAEIGQIRNCAACTTESSGTSGLDKTVTTEPVRGISRRTFALLPMTRLEHQVRTSAQLPAALIALIDRAGPAAWGPLTRPAYPATR